MIQQLKDWWEHHKTAKAAEAVARRGGAPNVEAYLASRGKGIPKRLQIEPERAETEILVAEQTETSLKIQLDARVLQRAKLPNKWFRRCQKACLWVFEVVALGYYFITDAGYPPITGGPIAVLYTTGMFRLTRALVVNLKKPSDEREWYTPWLVVVFLIGGASLIAARLISRNTTDTNPLGIIATAVMLAFATLLPAWLAAEIDLDLETIRDVDADVTSMTLEYHNVTTKIGGLRQGIHATTQEDIDLVDDRLQHTAIYDENIRKIQETQQHKNGGQRS